MELRNASVAVVDEDRSDAIRRIEDALLPPFFSGRNRSDAERDRRRHGCRPLHVRDRHSAALSGRRGGRPPPTIQLNVDATAMSQAGRGAGYIQSIIAQEMQTIPRPSAAENAEPPVRLVTRAKFNPNLMETWFLGVSQIVNNITMLAIILSGAALVREREHGTIEHLLVMPLTPGRHHAGEDLVERAGHRRRLDAVAALVVQGMLGVPIAGSVPLFMVGTAIYMFSVDLARHLPRDARALDAPVRAARLSGVPRAEHALRRARPRWTACRDGCRTSCSSRPRRHFVNLSMAILYRGAGLMSVWPDFAAVAAIGLVFFLAALARFRRTVSFMQA